MLCEVYNGEAFIILYAALGFLLIAFCTVKGKVQNVEREQRIRQKELARWEWSLEKRESDLQKSSRY